MSRLTVLALTAAVAWLSVAGAVSLRSIWLSAPGGQSGARPVDDMAVIRAGRAWIGCVDDLDTDCEDSEKPGRWVELKAFSIDRTEVRVADYRRCVRAGGCTTKGLRSPIWFKGEAHPEFAWSCNWGRPGREEHPINCVSWKQAVRYCRWVGKRLPTDAEWEKAARGGRRQIRPWGDEPLEPLQPRANVADESVKVRFPHWPYLRGYHDGALATAPVGSYPTGATPDGVLDMIGNVEEWTQDKFGDEKGLRSIKGASWHRAADLARVSRRYPSPKNSQPDYAGFRCVRSEAG